MQESVDMDFLVTDAIQMIKTRSITDLLPVAISLNINTDQDNLAIKRELVLAAKRKPQGSSTSLTTQSFRLASL